MPIVELLLICFLGSLICPLIILLIAYICASHVSSIANQYDLNISEEDLVSQLFNKGE